MTFQNIVFVCLTVVSVILVSSCGKNVSDSRSVVLWAWERPENLEFIDPEKTAVAFLAQTLTLSSDRVIVKPRRQPLKVPPGTTMIAVTRIETGKGEQKPDLSSAQLEKILDLTNATLELKDVTAIQIDFDALVSEREFYRQFLNELRKQLAPNFGLTMTALASWCISDRWIKGLPVDEAVPMIFEMGTDAKTIRIFLESGQDWNEPLCQKSYGISINERLDVKYKKNRKFYLFNYNPNGWSKSDLERVPNGVIL